MALISSKVAEDKRVELEISVGEELFAPAVERIYKKRAAQITLPGFRKGKAPRNLIVKTFGMGAFMEDAVNELYPAAYGEAIEEAGLEPVEAADISITSVDDHGFSFKAVVAVKPEAVLGEYKGLAVTVSPATVEEAQVDEQIASVRERNARLIAVTDRAAQNGDTATIDFEGFVDGVAFEGGKGDNYPLTLGSSAFIPGFEEQVVGHSVEEPFEVHVTFPEAYGVEELNGKAAVFHVVIHELKTKELPELDDEFAKDVSEFDTLAEYRADFRAKLEAAAEQNADTVLENDLMKEVVARMTVEVPQAMIDRRVDELVRDFEYRLQMQGLNMDQFMSYTGEGLEGFRSTFAPQADQQVRVRLALEAIVKAESLTPTPDQLDAEYARLADQYDLSADKIRSMVPEADMMMDLACNQALALVKRTAAVTVRDKNEAAGQASEPDKAEAAGEANSAQPESAPAAEETDAAPKPAKPARKRAPRAKPAQKAEETEEAVNP